MASSARIVRAAWVCLAARNHLQGRALYSFDGISRCLPRVAVAARRAERKDPCLCLISKLPPIPFKPDVPRESARTREIRFDARAIRSLRLRLSSSAVVHYLPDLVARLHRKGFKRRCHRLRSLPATRQADDDSATVVVATIVPIADNRSSQERRHVETRPCFHS